MMAVRSFGYRIQSVKKPTVEMWLEAVRATPYAVGCQNPQTFLICLEAVRINGKALREIRDQVPVICLAALAQEPDATCFVKIPLEISLREFLAMAS
jgi:hypothetical protein